MVNRRKRGSQEAQELWRVIANQTNSDRQPLARRSDALWLCLILCSVTVGGFGSTTTATSSRKSIVDYCW